MKPMGDVVTEKKMLRSKTNDRRWKSAEFVKLFLELKIHRIQVFHVQVASPFIQLDIEHSNGINNQEWNICVVMWLRHPKKKMIFTIFYSLFRRQNSVNKFHLHFHTTNNWRILYFFKVLLLSVYESSIVSNSLNQFLLVVWLKFIILQWPPRKAT